MYCANYYVVWLIDYYKVGPRILRSRRPTPLGFSQWQAKNACLNKLGMVWTKVQATACLNWLTRERVTVTVSNASSMLLHLLNQAERSFHLVF